MPIDVAPIIRGYWEQTSVKWEAEDGTPVDFNLITAPTLDPTILTDFENGCISVAAIGCISLGASSILLEVDDLKGNLLLRDVVTGEVTVHIPKAPGCVRARTRTASGKLSAATELCGSALSKRPFRNGDLDFLTCSLGTSPAEERTGARDGGVAPESAGDDDAMFGCAAVTPAGASGGWWCLLAIAALSLVRRLRRGSRRIPA